MNIPSPKNYAQSSPRLRLAESHILIFAIVRPLLDWLSLVQKVKFFENRCGTIETILTLCNSIEIRSYLIIGLDELERIFGMGFIGFFQKVKRLF